MSELVIIALSILVYMTFVFVLSQRLKRLDIVDVAWGGAFIVIAIASLSLGDKGWLQLLVSLLVVIWGLRLSFYILKRFVNSKSQDPRYVEMQRRWRGSVAVNSYFRIFVVQGILALIVSTSVILINLSPEMAFGGWAIAGVMVWIIGFLFESIGDRQLRNHLAGSTNKGKLMTSGLWRYTRHPNYFGEAVQWWGVFIIALSIPLGWMSIIAPLTITVLLLFVSGVPLTEKRFEGRLGWGAYKKRTSVFFPLPPRE